MAEIGEIAELSEAERGMNGAEFTENITKNVEKGLQESITSDLTDQVLKGLKAESPHLDVNELSPQLKALNPEIKTNITDSVKSEIKIRMDQSDSPISKQLTKTMADSIDPEVAYERAVKDVVKDNPKEITPEKMNDAVNKAVKEQFTQLNEEIEKAVSQLSKDDFVKECQGSGLDVNSPEAKPIAENIDTVSKEITDPEVEKEITDQSKKLEKGEGDSEIKDNQNKIKQYLSKFGGKAFGLAGIVAIVLFVTKKGHDPISEALQRGGKAITNYVKAGIRTLAKLCWKFFGYLVKEVWNFFKKYAIYIVIAIAILIGLKLLFNRLTRETVKVVLQDNQGTELSTRMGMGIKPYFYGGKRIRNK
jgi:hypothetical protein